MTLPNLSPVFISLSTLGFYLLWVVMGLNGVLEALFETKASGVFPNGRPLKMSYSGIGPIDDFLLILVVFFDGLNNLVDTGSYLMLLDLVSILLVINMMTLVESRRRERTRWLRFPALWQYTWNCAGIAVFLPIYSLFYVKQGWKGTSSLPTSEAQALPFTALWSLLLPLPLILPALVGASTFQIQNGVVLFFLTPPIFVGFQALVGTFISRISYKGSVKPVRIAYLIVGMVSALIHLGVVLYSICSSGPNMSFGRVYFPHQNAPQRGQSNIMTEGALLFIQYDYVITNITILILGTYILRSEPVFLAKSPNEKVRASGSVLALVGINAVFGAGAGMAFVLHCKERRLDSLGARSKLLPTVESDTEDAEEAEAEDARCALLVLQGPETNHPQCMVR